MKIGASQYIETEYFLRSDAIENGLHSSVPDETLGKLITGQIRVVAETV